MKSQTRSFIAIALFILIFGMILFNFSRRNLEHLPVFPATISRDCAPWDGAAFRVSIPAHDGAIVNISIYQSPDLAFPNAFSFPDESGRVGNALLLLQVGTLEELRGRVSFQRVTEGVSVEGKFDLETKMGEQFKGNFIAKWEDEIIMCG